jgi:hypothetical protein
MQFLEQERKQKERQDKERRRKQADIDKETDRLRREFGDQSNLLRPQQPPQPQRPAPVPAQPQGPYLQQHRPTASHSSFFTNGLPRPTPSSQPPKAKAKKSFWGLRTQSETTAEKLKKKKSSMF